MPSQKTLIQHIAAMCGAYHRCIASNNTEWRQRWSHLISRAARLLPSGGGFDAGTAIDVDKSNDDVVVLTTSFHHMNDAGSYVFWTHHVVTVRPTFDGVTLHVSGRNRNDVKAYIGETLQDVLTMPADLSPHESKD